MGHFHSLLSRPAILRQLGKGIIIEPFLDSRLKTCSYDVRLGEYYFRRGKETESEQLLFNPYDNDDVIRHYGQACQAKLAQSFRQYQRGAAQWAKIEPSDRIIILAPGEMILGHTEEFIGGTRDKETGRCFTAEMKARSSAGRVGLEVCRCAGWGDVGYVNRWTMEIVSTSPVPIVLVVGTRLAQMKFYEVDTVDPKDLYGFDKTRDNYQSGTNLADIMAAWRPEMLIPKLRKD